MKKYLFIFGIVCYAITSTAQTIQDSLAQFGKTYVVVSVKENFPDTITLDGKKYISVPGQNLETEKSVKGNLVIVSSTDQTSQALNLKGKIYVAESEIAMADFFRANGKIYVVVAVLSVILAGIFFYLISLDKKIQKLKNL